MLKKEMINWYVWFLKVIPGYIGCKIRVACLPSKIGNRSRIWDGVHIDYPSKLEIGENTSINRGSILNCGGGISIGSNVLIGPNVTIYSQNHIFEDKNYPISSQGYEYKKVTIGDDVWIASGVIITPGVVIGKGAVIGAGSVVTKDVVAYDVVVGVPANKISSRQ
ncbi:acyltransferase [Shewanella algae]|uniref:acyltransferase n=1 Tax=Shewanella algae TaxID=38313 RepID=UPI001184426A|nr:DapH/DapD/GlmU-related protein [Shewanella algae]TVO82165.1 acyltransferase [Shewanella algae]TVO83303.1 acyltransferase [Shewanella algae]TVO87694.1 acyltransferase [Shewanella algae]TVO94619.1 acyltransferase [Shewanella algae]TXS85023.1 acyltransferase [Shewanella algae]